MVHGIWLTILLPLLGAAFLLFFGKLLGEPRSGILASALVFAGFVVALGAALPHIGGSGAPVTHVHLFTWIPSLGIEASLLWDPLSAMMTLVVTGVGALIHVYSIGYMHGDPRNGRFFSYLNLFIASMLILVLGDNFGILFVGWELVGLSSYLLISFWFDKPSAAAAGKKAFVVNRIGDFGFLVALMMIFSTFGSLDFETVFEHAPGLLSRGAATAITLLLLVGAAGKSAQLPLYVWLPDAMEGPTPVSALIHAATMVTAGVYMTARSGALFELAPFSAATVATVGILTALFAATIAIGQRDIKRVLAYSTISQLGYMFLGVGAAAYVGGVFHLLTHAFFKALLFLGAGSVIHALSGEQDMWKMGGLRRVMPITFATMAAAWLAISGIPPFAGFWSKDEILAATFDRGGAWVLLWAIGLLTAGLTAFYMSRLMYLTFWGESRWDAAVHPHESPRTMTVPLVVLGVLSLIGGLVNTPFLPALEHFLEPAFELTGLAGAPQGATPWLLALVSVAAGVAGIWYARRRYVEQQLPDETGPAWDRLEHGYYVDDAYGRGLVIPARRGAEVTAFVGDAKVVDGAVNGVGWLVRRLSQILEPIQTGLVRNYGIGIVAGVVGFVLWVLVRGGAIG
jgi:NADH-quinone oxidoreductase subunit L